MYSNYATRSGAVVGQELMYYTIISSPIGQLILAGTSRSLQLVGLPGGENPEVLQDHWVRNDDPFLGAASHLSEYFRGGRPQFDLALEPHGTQFQIDVLNSVAMVRHGEKCTYADIAESIGRPKALRAVGNAIARNPLPIVIPCHRVVGRHGDLEGFRGGLRTKRYLLDLERRNSGLFDPTVG